MKNSQTVYATIQAVSLIVALILLALNRHESFQDIMIISLVCGTLDNTRRELKDDDE